jgi:hypothetical protein
LTLKREEDGNTVYTEPVILLRGRDTTALCWTNDAIEAFSRPLYLEYPFSAGRRAMAFLCSGPGSFALCLGQKELISLRDLRRSDPDKIWNVSLESNPADHLSMNVNRQIV